MPHTTGTTILPTEFQYPYSSFGLPSSASECPGSPRLVIQILFFFVPTFDGRPLQSPRWLIKRGRDADAASSLARLLRLKPEAPEVEVELDDIRTNLAEEMRIGETGYIDCFTPGPNKLPLRTLTGIFIQAWYVKPLHTFPFRHCNFSSRQQLTGINFIFYFGTSIFQNAGIKQPFLITVATNIVNVFMTLPGMWGVERFGRRRLLLVGAIGMCVCEFIVSSVQTRCRCLQSHLSFFFQIAIVGVTISVQNTSGQKALVAFVCIYIAFFASTWGPIAWIVTGEIFPLAVRAKAMSLSVASNW
jgi:SP family sugar:H+ symporter-like MFS transporter